MRPDAVRSALDVELAAARARRGGDQPRVLDVGGGSGVFAVPMAQAGCAVTVVEPNPNALATLHRRATDAGVADRIVAVQADSDVLATVVPDADADVVLAHGLLEVVDDPKATVAALVGAVRPGGVVSVVVANRYSAVLHRALAGKLAEARRVLVDPAGRTEDEALLRRFDVDALTALLVDAGLTVEVLQGAGALADLVPGSVLEASQEALAELELVAATTPALRAIASRLHAVARRPA
ncbi:class I SAM-dependent methyltransferase [Labedaea rhizosphaerae]|uniref:FkbM family methyltransferase n=1 Tax=Labedaea rhizosphaerae TaxID=598644 RepID=A0A4R6SBC6_LABRH|nr:class I SAM-dependent methyltransferase [Labedaea rhizosphaerae]TDP97240.1 FkbM family methyltransferase [Labedaea rhizosphaerae]